MIRSGWPIFFHFLATVLYEIRDAETDRISSDKKNFEWSLLARPTSDDDVGLEIVNEWFLETYSQTESAEDLVDKNDIVHNFLRHFDLQFEEETLKRKRHKIMTGMNKCINSNRERYGKVKTKVHDKLFKDVVKDFTVEINVILIKSNVKDS